MILQRYILKELLLSFAFAFATVMAVCLVGTMFQVFRAFEGLGFLLLIKVLPLALGYVALWALLVATCTATTLVYGRLAAENEINAMRTCGIHANSMIAPALLFGLLLSAGGYVLNEYAVPAARHGRRMSFREATLQLLKLPPPGKRTLEIGQYKLSYMDYQNGRMERPTLKKFEGHRLVIEYFAPSGAILADVDPPRIVMSKPRYTQYDEKGGQHTLSAESDVAIPLEIEEVRNAEPQPEDRPATDLIIMILEAKEKKARDELVTILHTRYASSLTPFLLVLIAVPIGILVRKGSRLAGLGAALPPLLVYFVSFFVCQGLGKQGKLDPLIASYAPDSLLLVIAVALLWGVYRK